MASYFDALQMGGGRPPAQAKPKNNGYVSVADFKRTDNAQLRKDAEQKTGGLSYNEFSGVMRGLRNYKDTGDLEGAYGLMNQYWSKLSEGQKADVNRIFDIQYKTPTAEPVEQTFTRGDVELQTAMQYLASGDKLSAGIHAREHWGEFDNSHKVEINDALGAPETWYRGENKADKKKSLSELLTALRAKRVRYRRTGQPTAEIDDAIQQTETQLLVLDSKPEVWFDQDVEMWYTADNLQKVVDDDRREKAQFRPGASSDDYLITPTERQQARDALAESTAKAGEIAQLRQIEALLGLNGAENYEEAQKLLTEFFRQGDKAAASDDALGYFSGVERDYLGEIKELEQTVQEATAKQKTALQDVDFYLTGAPYEGYQPTYESLAEAVAAAEKFGAMAQEGNREIDSLQKAAKAELEDLRYTTQYQYWIDYANADGKFDEYKQYVPTGAVEKARDSLSTLTGKYMDVDKDALMYEYINGDETTKGWVQRILMTNDETTWRFTQEIYDHISEEERETYNAIYNDPKRGPRKASEYLRFLKTTMTARDRQANEAEVKAYAEEHPFLGSVGSVVKKAVLSPEAIIYGGIDLLTEGEIDKNAPYFRGVYESNATRQQVGSMVEKNWGEAGSFAYNVGMSMADFLAALGLSGGNGSISMVIMGSSSAAATTLDALDRGVSSGRAYTLGILSGAVEALTEKVSIDALLDAAKLGKSAGGYILKNMLAEGSEEGTSNLLNWMLDVVISQDKSQWRQTIDAYMAEGMSENEAFRKALLDQAESLGMDMLAGAVSGGVMGTGGAAVNAVGNRLLNGQTKSAGSGVETTEVPQYDIVALEDGKVYVQASRKVINGTTNDEIKADVTSFFNELLEDNGKLDIPTLDGDVLTLTMAETEYKARDDYKTADGKRIPLTKEEFALKARVESHIDEIAETSRLKNKKREPDNKNHTFAKDGFTYPVAFFRDFDGQYYKITLSVGNNGDVATVYNVGLIDKSDLPAAKIIAATGSKAIGKSLSTDSISNSAENSNNNFESQVKGLYGYKGVDPKRWYEFKRAERIAKRFGLGFHVQQLQNGADGQYLNGTITISPTAQNPVRQVLIHELTHHLENSGLYESFSNMILNYAANKMQVDVENVKRQITEQYAKAGTTLDDVGATKELVAKYAEEYLFQDEAAVRQLLRQDRNLFDKIYNWICDTLEMLGGKDSELTEAEQFLREAEAMYKRALEDAGTAADVAAKNTATNGGVAQNSLRIQHSDGNVEELGSAKNLTKEQAINYLNRAKSGELRRETYIPVRKDTPQTVIYTMAGIGESVDNNSLIMQVRKAQQSMSDSRSGRRAGRYGSNIRSHALTPEQIVEIVNKLDDPSMAIYQTNRTDPDGNPQPNNVAFFVEYDNNGTESVAVIEFDSSIDPQFVGTEYGDTNYHTVVTVFEPDVERNGMPFDYAEELLSNPNNLELEIKRRQPEGSATGANQPNTSNELSSSKDSIRNSDTKYNPQNTESQNSMGSTFSELAERASQENPSVGEADSSLYRGEPLDGDLYELDGQETLDDYLEELTNQEMMGMFPATEEDARARVQDLDEFFELVQQTAERMGPPSAPPTDGSELVNAKSEKTKEPLGRKIRNSWNYFKRKMVDSGTTVADIGKQVRDRHLYHYYNMARGSSNAAIHMITNARTDIYGRNTGKSLNAIFDPIRKRGDDYYNRFQLYLFHRHNVDRMSRESSTDVEAARNAFETFRQQNPELNGYAEYQIEQMAHDETSPFFFAAGEFIQLRNAMQHAERVRNLPVFGAEHGAQDSRMQADRLVQENPEFAELAQDVYDYIDNLMQYRVDSGLITADDRAILSSIYPHYVPTYRITDQQAGQRRTNGVQVGSTIGRAQGGDGQLMPLHKALAMQTMNVVREGSKNRFGLRLMENGRRSEHIRDVHEAENVFHENTFDEQTPEEEVTNRFIVREGGHRYEMEISPELYEAVKALSPDQKEANVATKLVRKGNDLFKKLVTGYNPLFMVRNFFRDLQDASFYSKDLSEFVKNYPQAWKEIATNGEFWQRYQAMGGTFSSVFDYDTGETDSGNWVKRNIINRIELLNQAVEQAPRLAEFMATIKKHGGLDAGQKNSAESGGKIADYQRQGHHGIVLDTVRAHLAELQDMAPVKTLTGLEFQKTNDDTRSLRERVLEFFNTIGNKVTRTGFGDIALNNAGVRDSLGHGYGKLKAATFAALPDVLQDGQIIHYDPNYEQRGYESFLIAAPVNVGKETCYVGAMVIKDSKTQRYKVHEVLTVNENGTPSFKTESPKNGGNIRDSAPSSAYSIPGSSEKSNGNVVANADAEMDILMEAMYNAADITVNFGRSGTLGKALNANYIPFLNPSIQGFDKMIRNVTETKGAKNWLRLIGKAALLGFAPTLINGLLYEDDDEWEDIKDSDKDTNYLFKLRDGLWLKIPKGRTLSLLGMTADRTKDSAEGKEINWGGFIQTAAAQTAPANPLEQNILKAWFDADLFDKDSPGKTWYGGDIENQRLQGYEPGQRYDAKTDVLSKWLGDKLNLSPKKINYLLDQYSGVIGDVLLPLMTPTAERDMFTAGFTVDSTASNRLSQDFYGTLDELTYRKNAPDATGDDAVLYRFWNKQGSAISEVNKAIRAIEEDASLSDKDKKDLLHAQYAIRNGIIKAAEGNYEAYAEAAAKHYAKAYGTQEEKKDYAYLMANRDVLGAEYALQNYSKSAYEKASGLNAEGISYDDSLDMYLKFRAADDMPKEEAYRRERDILVQSDLTEEQKILTYETFISDKKGDEISAFRAAGLSFDDYLSYEAAVYGLGSDETSTKKEKVMEVIDGMDISDEQKDAVYAAAGYSERTIDEAPWRAGTKALPLPAPGKSNSTRSSGAGSKSNGMQLPKLELPTVPIPKLELEMPPLPKLELPM